MLGRYVDALPVVARERVITGRLWRTQGYVDRCGGRSLLGHAEDWRWDSVADACDCRGAELIRIREVVGDSWLNWPPAIDVRYDHLVDRLGLEKATGLLRARALRAAHGNTAS